MLENEGNQRHTASHVPYQETSSDPHEQDISLSPSHPQDDLDDSSVPIALKKGFHSYTKHPLSNSVSHYFLPFTPLSLPCLLSLCLAKYRSLSPN